MAPEPGTAEPTFRPLLAFLDYSSQYAVDARLVAPAFGLEPVHHFIVHAQANPLPARTVPACPQA